MQVIIVEDELAASENLAYLLQSMDETIEVEQVLESVTDAVDYFSRPYKASLIFMDIHLADGLSFEIFEKVEVTTPIIFTTAYDQYALKAFKVNSIDYLLKPIDEEELSEAIKKFQSRSPDKDIDKQQIDSLLNLIGGGARKYRETFLVSHRDQLIPLKTDSIAYFRIDTGVVKGVTVDNKSYVMDTKLEEIEEGLDPAKFYRVNRQFIVKKEALESIKYYFNGKLIITLSPACDERVVVSKAKATAFKNWVNS